MPESPPVPPRRRPADDLRGVSRLIIEATVGITDLVREVHDVVGSGPAILGQPLALPTRAINRVVYGGVVGMTRAVGVGLDEALARLAMMAGETETPEAYDAVVAAVNGVLGDYLEATANPLAIPMALRRDGSALDLSDLESALPDAGPRLLLMVHGSSMGDHQWRRGDHDHGEIIARRRGLTRVDLNYNSGRHISTNGAELARQLDALVHAWPVPLEEIVVVGHSMGGLILRSACRHAERLGLSWRERLSTMIFLGTPHHGSPLERLGHHVDTLLDLTPYSAPFGRLGKIRSAGVTDLRHGLITEDDWTGRDRFAGPGPEPTRVALPDGVDCYAIAGELPGGLGGSLPGDGLVPVDSALGRHADPGRDLGLPAERVWVARDTSHLGLLASPAVTEVLLRWIPPAP